MAIQFSCTSEAAMSPPVVEILLIQHDQEQVDLTLNVLDTHHFADRIHVVRDGPEALEFLFCTGAYADRAPGNPRLVLLDLDLAYRDNLEILRQIKRDARTSHIPVTIIAPSTDDRLAAMQVLRTYDMQVPVVVMAGATLQEAAQAFELARDGADGAGPGAGPAALRPDPELESLARLARGIAHEFNNLFSVIVAYTELLLRDLDLDDPRRDGADAIFKSIARASKLTRQLLTFSPDTTRGAVLTPPAAPQAQTTTRNGKGAIGPA
jgi:CheY-like chemotaxis protein